MTAAQRELITAAVDGELSATEQRAFSVLVKTFPEAKALFAKLSADKARVRALPQSTPPANLQARILAKIASATPAPRMKPKVLSEPARKPVPVPNRGRAWVPAAVAASVLLSITAGSFAFFRSTGANQQVAKQNWGSVLPNQHDSPTPVPSPIVTPDPLDVARVDVRPVPPLPGVPYPREVVRSAVVVAPAPRAYNPDLIGFPVQSPLPPFERIEIRVPFLRSVAELGLEDIGQELLATIDGEPGVAPMRFDLFVRDTARGVEVLQKAAKVSGVAVHADATTLDRLKRKQVHAVVVYTESLSPAELVSLFGKLAAEDAKYSPRVGESLHATAVVRADELELRAVLGQDVGLYKRPTGNSSGAGQGTRGAPQKPLSSGTIDSVVQSVSGSPGSASSPAAKNLDKHAVLMTWQTTHPNLPRTNPMSSAELKHYFQKRGGRKPNAIPAIIVIRLAG